MQNLCIKGSTGIYLTPDIKLNAKTGQCEITGESYLENAREFYKPVLEWLQEYVKIKPVSTIFNFRLTYFNTSSSKAILEILLCLKKLKELGGSVQINWYYPNDDFDLLAEAEDFMEDADIHLNLIPYKLDY